MISISSIFRQEQLFFKPYGGFYRSILKNYDHFFVQNPISVELLKSVGIMNCTIAGDTRFDRVYSIVQEASEIPIAKAFKAGQKTVVVGSCWPEDLEVLTPMINEGKMKFILAPHEINETFLSTIERTFQVKSTIWFEEKLLLPENGGDGNQRNIPGFQRLREVIPKLILDKNDNGWISDRNKFFSVGGRIPWQVKHIVGLAVVFSYLKSRG